MSTLYTKSMMSTNVGPRLISRPKFFRYLNFLSRSYPGENRHVSCLRGSYLPTAIVLMVESGFFWKTVNSLPDVMERASAISEREVGLPCCRSNSRRTLLLSMIGPITSTTGRRKYLIIKKGFQEISCQPNF